MAAVTPSSLHRLISFHFDPDTLSSALEEAKTLLASHELYFESPTEIKIAAIALQFFLSLEADLKQASDLYFLKKQTDALAVMAAFGTSDPHFDLSMSLSNTIDQHQKEIQALSLTKQLNQIKASLKTKAVMERLKEFFLKADGTHDEDELNLFLALSYQPEITKHLPYFTELSKRFESFIKPKIQGLFPEIFSKRDL